MCTFEDIESNKNEFKNGFTGMHCLCITCLSMLKSLIESSVSFAKLMPNPLRIKSGGRLVLSVPLILFMDDVSGNISKQWNKHHVVYMSNAAMPREMIEKEFCVRFVSSSPHATPLELMSGVSESVK